MNKPEFDDETLMAFADGEADAVTRARIMRVMAGDPDIAARVEMFRASRARVSGALKPLFDETVPPALKMSVEAMIERDVEARAQKAAVGNKVVSLHAQRAKRKSLLAAPWFAPLAACIVLSVGAAAGYAVGVKMPAQYETDFASIRDPAIMQALYDTPSGKQIDLPASGRTLEPVLSFQLEDGTLCREFKLRELNSKGVISIACLESNRWQTHLVMAATRPEEGYVPAGSAETIDAYLASIHAGSPLDGTAEEEALRSIRH
jgi:anti-sigma factor RsiW